MIMTKNRPNSQFITFLTPSPTQETGTEYLSFANAVKPTPLSSNHERHHHLFPELDYGRKVLLFLFPISIVHHILNGMEK